MSGPVKAVPLAGRSANIILEDAEVPIAVLGVIRSLYTNQGASRCAASRLFVQEKVHAAFVEALVAAVKGLRVGDPLDPETRVGPLLSAELRDRVLTTIKVGRKEGARLVCGGGVPREPSLARGFYLEPALFVDAERRMHIAREEIEGPVLVALRFRTDEEVASLFNETRGARAGAVWTRDIERGVRLLTRLRAGLLWLNDYDPADGEEAWSRPRSAEWEAGLEGLEPYLALKRIRIGLGGEPSRSVT